eukprot:CAMPEP_0181334664 /NCGR_PEP_ID=MMETSP1101-20121128/26392_1 /TAXON_ID=46948 /ORGANISM="Rhodomonas abbreviata, Strain Caron Lab Isolate" /LENGTH=355 /DNA_ID=CAMNT_0023444679 /DNA_START=12 /DNA_END=1075 /DNA_ORIENTATION=+
MGRRSALLWALVLCQVASSHGFQALSFGTSFFNAPVLSHPISPKLHTTFRPHPQDATAGARSSALKTSTCMKLSTNIQRRHVLITAAVSAWQLLQKPQAPHSILVAQPCQAAAPQGAVSAARLLSVIPEMPFGQPATNGTITPALAQEIEAQAEALEQQGGRDTVKSPLLSGSWRLLYTNAREIRNLASGLPLGFVLGKVYQPVDTTNGFFENQGEIEHVLGLAKASNCVIGDVRIAKLGTLNAAGTVNTAGNRIDVDFRRITFALDELLGRPASLRKVIVTKKDPQALQPANDITYLEQGMRVTRGGDGSLFIFRREESGRPMLTQAQREALYSEGGGEEVSLFGDAQKDGEQG